MSAHPPCRLRALGLLTCLGATHEQNWSGLIAGDRSRLRPRPDLVPGHALFAPVSEPLPAVPDALARYRCRNNQLALATFAAIRADVEEALRQCGAERLGIVVGTSTSGLSESEAAFRALHQCGEYPRSFALEQLEFGGLAEFLQRVSGAGGPCYVLSTACSSGGKALIAARTLLELDVCDAVIAGAADSLCELTAKGFHALQALARGHSSPMSRARDGINLGEGAALFLLTREPGGVQLLGAGESCDAYHASAPDPQGRGAESCMRAALADAGLRGDAIAYLNLHGTGTPLNDAMESGAVARVLGPGTPCSSTKPIVGHTLGASAAIEAAFCWLMLTRAEPEGLLAPPHCWDGAADPELPALALVKPGTRLPSRRAPALMSNSFGFGGNNCALVLGTAGP
jgi:3-oxoacyl-[acyl-carrier-protein] synthase-1